MGICCDHFAGILPELVVSETRNTREHFRGHFAGILQGFGFSVSVGIAGIAGVAGIAGIAVIVQGLL